MKRIFAVLAVTALMVAMLVASAMPAFAAPSCANGQHQAHSNAPTTDLVDKHFVREFACDVGVPPGGIK